VTTVPEARAKGHALAERVVRAIAAERNESERTLVAKARGLGMSDLGGCREYLRATIAGEPRGTEKKINWAAEVGTAVGDHVEAILHRREGMDIQETVTLPFMGFEITGHIDELDVTRDLVADNKTVDGLDDVRREMDRVYENPTDDPRLKNKIQISGYLEGLILAGRLSPDATGHLLYFDRSGKQAEPYVWSATRDVARYYLEVAEDRLKDVQHALATGTRNGRDGRLMTDEPESYCFAIQCPFYQACWAGYAPTGKIEHPRELDAVRRRLEALAEAKAAAKRSDQAKQDLRGVEGVVETGPHKGTIVQWTLKEMESGRITETLYVKEPK
jgi:hypothetical protein